MKMGFELHPNPWVGVFIGLIALAIFWGPSIIKRFHRSKRENSK